MKKNKFFTFLALFLVISGNLVFAEEKISQKPLSFAPSQGDSKIQEVPFEISVSPGKWSQADLGQPFTTGNHLPDFVLPWLKENPAPIHYPRWAVREGWEGTFMIAVEILITGEVDRWQITQSTSYPLLDETATKAILKWHFHPAREGGKSIVSCIQIPVHFRLEERSSP